MKKNLVYLQIIFILFFIIFNLSFAVSSKIVNTEINTNSEIAISGNIIAFIRGTGLFYYDYLTKQSIYTGIYNVFHISISGNIIVFQHESFIKYYDISKKQVFNTGAVGQSPKIDGNIIVFITREGDSGDLDGDGIISNKAFIRYYDISINKLVNTGIFFSTPIGYFYNFVPISFSKNLIAYPVYEERSFIGLGYSDFNGDGDYNDVLIFYYDILTGKETNTGQIGRHPSIFNGRMIFSVPEADWMGGYNQDLNNDGDLLDHVLYYYDINTKEFINTKIQSEFNHQLYENLIVFQSSEVWLGIDINGDGVLHDFIRIVSYYNLLNNSLTITEVFSATSTLLSYIPSPQSSNGEIIIFNIREDEVRKDLNQDGDIYDIILSYYQINDFLPSQFYSQIQNVPNWLELRLTPGIANKIESDLLKILPNSWVLKVLSTIDSNGNNVDLDGYRWYKVQDVTDGTIGWMAAKDLNTGTIYLDYNPALQTDLENKASVQLTTSDQRKSVILDAVDTYYVNSNTVDSLYGGGGGKDGNNNFQAFIQGSNFPKELVLSIAAQESGSNFDNEICSSIKDGGIGIMQITSLYFKGLGSGLENILHKNDCDVKIGWIGDISKYYSNAIQGIYANIKDGFRVIQEKYRQKCPQADIIINGYTFTCQDIEKILTTWGYNGFAKDKTSGLYTGNYLKYVADKLKNLGIYFAGIIYSNTDNFIEKLEIASNNKQVIRLYSPATFQVIDELGRITGVQNNTTMEDIPNSLYERDYEGAVIFFPSVSYHYQITGTNTGIYKFTVDYTKEGILKNFTATDIPINQGEIHDYFIDWNALDSGERGVSVNIDYDGNGTVDQVINSDSVLTDIELPQITSTQLNSEYLYNSQIQINFNATDIVSGIANISAILNGNTIQNGQFFTLNQSGINIFTIIAIDNDGNITTLNKTFNVIYNFSNFLPPIKMDGSGIYSQGRTLPIKFQLTDSNGNFVSNASVQLYVAKIADGIIGNDEIPLSVSSADIGNQFRYDFTNNQYIYNLSTDTLSVGSWQLKALLDSGQVFVVIISIR